MTRVRLGVARPVPDLVRVGARSLTGRVRNGRTVLHTRQPIDSKSTEEG